MISSISISADTHAPSVSVPARVPRSKPTLPLSEERFTRVVQPYMKEAYALARLLTGSHADAQDVVQEACIRALRGIGVAPIRSARGWIMTIVRHAAYDWMAKNRSNTLLSVGDVEDIESMQSDIEVAATPETALLDLQYESLLESATAMLPAHYRETLVLHAVEGLKYREIANLTGVPIGTVTSRLARARSELVAAMNKNGSRVAWEP